MEPNIPERIGKYEIQGELGRGGMGVVYKALNRRMAMQVAIKTVSQDFASDTRMLESFYREAEKTAMLRHVNIVSIYDVGDQDGAPYIVMEYLPGESLQHIIDDNRAMPLIEKLVIVEQLCSALGYAHQHDVIHRDVKPANVIVQPNGIIKLLDFGIARQENRTDITKTQFGKVKGTVPYMAPEQLKGGDLDARCDIWATGVLLFQLLTGVLPFEGGEPLVIMNRILTDPPPPLGNFIPAYPPLLDTVLEHALAKELANRYPTAEDMGADLYAVIDGLKREHIASVVGSVKTMIAEQQFVRAREVLLAAQKLDPQHTEVRAMVNEVNGWLGRRQREDNAQQLVAQAKDLIRDKNFDKAVEILVEASKNLPDDRFIAALLEDAKKEKSRREQLEALLRQAQVARDQGNLKSAVLIMDRAIALDDQDSRVRQLHNALARQADEAGQREAARELVDQARVKLRNRRYEDALALLRKAEEFDPLQPDLQSLRSSAESGLAEEERRTVVETMEAKAANAATQEDVAQALAMVEDALNQFRDPTLFRLQAELTRQLQEFEARILVDKTIQECQAKLEFAPHEALDLVQTVLLQLPADDRLLVLYARIREHLARIEQERLRNAYLEQAHRALKSREYREAVRVLELCQGDLLTNEITELLRFARREAQQQEQQDLLTATLAHANQLLREDEFEAALSYIEPLVAERNEPGLRALLEQARSRQSIVAKETADALNRIRPWAEENAHTQVIAFLEALSPSLLRVNAVADALRAAREARDREVNQLLTIGYAYACLDSRNPGVEWTPLTTLAPADPAWMTALQTELVTRRAQVAGSALATYVDDIEQQLDSGAFTPAGRWIAAHAGVFPFLDPHTSEKWEGLRERARLRKNATSGERNKRKGR